MNFIGSLLGVLSEDVTFLVDRLLLLFTTLSNCNFYLVRTLMIGLSRVGDVVVSLVAGLGYGLQDFTCFVRDLLAILIAVLENVEAFVFAVCRGVSTAVQLTIAFLVSCAWWLTSSATWLTSGALAVVHLVGRALGLLWRATVVFLSMFPRTLMYFCTSIQYLAVYFADKVSRGFEAIHWSVQKAMLGVLNAPLDAYLGLVLLVLTWYLFRRYNLLHRIQMIAVKTPVVLKRLGSSMATRLTRGLTLVMNKVPRLRDETNLNTGSATTSRSGILWKTPAPKEESEDEDVVLGLRKRVEQLQEMNLCVVCQETSRCVTLLPCRHLCLCQACTRPVLATRPVCPICRKGVEEVLRVYT